jgi:hypothetical protein
MTGPLVSESSPHYIWVIYHSKKYSKIHAKGNVTGAVAGMVLKLYSDEFPYNVGWLPIRQVTFRRTGTDYYNFTDAPTLATRYKLELFANSTSSTLLAVTKATTVYVLANYHYYPIQKCGRPICRLSVHFYVIVPSPVLGAEAVKRVYGYFNYTLARNKKPTPPQWLYQGIGHLRITRSRVVAADRYDYKISFWFKDNQDKDSWTLGFCSKDTERLDGLNLPGHHHCGDRRVSASNQYLG